MIDKDLVPIDLCAWDPTDANAASQAAEQLNRVIGRVVGALVAIEQIGGVDGAHHKQYGLDQALRALTGCQRHDTEYWTHFPAKSPVYKAWVAAFERGEDGPKTYEWDEGIAPRAALTHRARGIEE